MMIRTIFSALRSAITRNNDVRKHSRNVVSIVGCESLEDRKLLTAGPLTNIGQAGSVDLEPAETDSSLKSDVSTQKAAMLIVPAFQKAPRSSAKPNINPTFTAGVDQQEIGFLLPAVLKVDEPIEPLEVDLSFTADVDRQEIGLLLPAVQMPAVHQVNYVGETEGIDLTFKTELETKGGLLLPALLSGTE